MSEWTTPGLDQRGKLRERAYSLLIVGYEVNWKTGRMQPVRSLLDNG